MGEWISVKDRLPEEHDSIFAKRYEEGSQLRGMFRKTSDEVIVSGVFEDGGRFVTTKKTHDGAWYQTGIIPMTITHWMPLPEPSEEDSDETD